MSGWVLVTRAADELRELRAVLAGHDISVVPYPVLRQVPWDDAAGWQQVAQAGGSVRWLAFTSPRAPAALRRSAETHGRWQGLRGLPVAAVGSSTAAAAREVDFEVPLTGTGGGRELAHAFLERISPGGLVLHACGREHRGELAVTLGAAGVPVVDLAVYAMDETPAPELPELPHDAPLAVLLTSPRAAGAYRRALAGSPLTSPHYAMGRTTAAAATALGIAASPLRRASVTSFVEEICQR